MICYDFSGELFIGIVKKKKKKNRFVNFIIYSWLQEAVYCSWEIREKVLIVSFVSFFNESEEMSYLHVYKEEYITNQTFAARKQFWAP